MKRLLTALALAAVSASAFAQNVSPDGHWEALNVTVSHGNTTTFVLDRFSVQRTAERGIYSARIIAQYGRPVPYGRDLADRTIYFYSVNCLSGEIRADAASAQAGSERTVYHTLLDGRWSQVEDGNVVLDSVCRAGKQ
jgi:hypothetical protein